MTSKSEPTLTHYETSITRQISLFPWTKSWRRHCHKQTTPIGRIDRPKNRARIDNFDKKTDKPLKPVTNYKPVTCCGLLCGSTPQLSQKNNPSNANEHPPNQLLRLAWAKSDISTKETSITPMPKHA